MRVKNDIQRSKIERCQISGRITDNCQSAAYAVLQWTSFVKALVQPYTLLSYRTVDMLQGYSRMLDKLNFKRDKIVDIQKALNTADINQDKQLDFDEWRQDLKT